MNRIIRFYNQNRRIIWTVAIAIGLAIAIIYALNNIEIQKHNNETLKDDSVTTTKDDYKNNLDISVTISDENVSEKKELIIDQFIRYCNAGEIQNAYNLLSDSCKEEIYPTIELFKQNYINKVFKTTKLYSKERYRGLTYKVKLYEDIMASGSLSESTVQDYFTIEKTDNDIKLNISNFIGEKEINKAVKNDILKINVKKKKIYKEYEVYVLEVQNLSNKEILLDSMEKTKTVYLQDEKGTKDYSLLYENTKAELTIPAGVEKTMNITFSKQYNSGNSNKYLVFSDIIKDNSEYSKLKNKSDYKDRGNFIINL